MSDIEPKICRLCGTSLPAETPVNICTRCALADVSKAGAEDSDLQPLNLRDIPPPGQRVAYIGDYELLEIIARGGMGVVYKARQRSLNRMVALKMLLSGAHASDEYKRRFRHEAKMAAKLQHPGIVPIYEVGEYEGQLYFSMEFVADADQKPAPTLTALVKDRPLEPKRAAIYLRAIAEAVQFAHEQGVIHRDLKPSNILIDAHDHPRVTDFGLAREFEADQSLTMTGQVMGTPGYMPPEQVSGTKGEMGAWSDVYSLGAVCYHLVTGRPPFQAATIADALHQVVHAEPAAPRRLNQAIPVDLETICLKCLEKEPRRRYADAKALALDCGRFLAGEPIHARPINVAERVTKWIARHPVTAVLSSAVVATLFLGFLGVTWQWHRAENLAIQAQKLNEKLELRIAEELFTTDNANQAVAYLADVMRKNPTNSIAVQRLVSALSQRGFCIPVDHLPTHNGLINTVHFSPDGKRVVTASQDHTARIWDAMTGVQVGESLRHEASVHYATYSPDGRYIVTTSDDHIARLWDATNAILIKEFQHDAPVWEAHMSFDATRLLTICSDGTGHLWNLLTGSHEILLRKGKGGIWRSNLSTDGNLAAFACNDGEAIVWDCSKDRALWEPFKHQGPVFAVEFSHDGRLLVTASQDGTARVFDLNQGKLLTGPFQHEQGLLHARFSQDGSLVATACEDGTARIWDLKTGRVLSGPMRHKGLVYFVDFSPDGNLLLTSSSDRTARVWDVHTGKPLTEPLIHADEVRTAEFSPDGTFVVTRSITTNSLIWRLRLNQCFELVLPHPKPVTFALISRDSKNIVTVSEDHCVRNWNVETGVEVWPSLCHTSRVRIAAFDSDETRLVTSCEDGRARIFENRTGRLITDLPTHHAPLVEARFSEDGKSLVTSSDDGTAKIWDAQTGADRGVTLKHEARLRDAVFSPDGRKIATVAADKTVWVWDADTGNLLLGPLRHDYTLLHAKFSQDGRVLFTYSLGRPAKAWSAETGLPFPESDEAGLASNPLDSRDRSGNGGEFGALARDDLMWIEDRKSGEAMVEPIHNSARVNFGMISNDGRLAMSAASDGTVRIRCLPQILVPAPPWLCLLGEALAKCRLNESGIPETRGYEDLVDLRRTIVADVQYKSFSKWAQELLDVTNQTSPGKLPRYWPEGE